MYCVNMLLTSSEWIRIRDAAAKQFPNETLSRGEVCRRFTLAGIGVLKNVPARDQAALEHEFQCSMEAGDERLRH